MCAVAHAAFNAGIAVLYSLVTILICQLIWQSKNSGTHMFLWGLSFASYTLKLVDKVFEKSEEARKIMMDTREQCVCQTRSGHTGNHDTEKDLEWKDKLEMPLERPPRGPRRPRRRCLFLCDDEYTSRIDGRCYEVCVYKQGDGHTRHQCAFHNFQREHDLMVGSEIDYKINWKDRQDDTTTFSALRRRDIMTLHKIFEDIAAIDGASDTLGLQDDRS